MEHQEVFSTSLYGRFGYFIWGIAAALVMAIFAGGVRDIIFGNFTGGILLGLLIILSGVSGCYFFVLCLRGFLNFSFRFKVTNVNIVYNGFLNDKIFLFENINKIDLDFSGSKSPFVYLLIYSSERNKPFRLDASGLQPNYKMLHRCITEQLELFNKLNKGCRESG